MNKQQTAVEWLVQKVELISNNKTLSKKEAIDLYNKSIEQAKKMESQQMKEMYLKGIENYDPTFKRKEQ